MLALLTLLLLDRLFFSHQAIRRSAGLLLAGAFVAWAPWLVFVALNWSDFVQQAMLFRDRFHLLSASFYAWNLRNEVLRYRLAPWSLETLSRSGFWLLVPGVPAALIWLSRRAVRGRDREALTLLVPSLLLPSLFALFIMPKRFEYTASIVPLFATTMAWFLTWLLQSPERGKRFVARSILAFTIVQGGYGIARMQVIACRATSPDETLRELKRIVPLSARVLGTFPPWLALAGRDYRSIRALEYLSSPMVNHPVPFEEAMRRVAPDFVLMNPPPSSSREGPILPAVRRLMNERRALIRELPDADGQVLQVYQIDWSERPFRAP